MPYIGTDLLRPGEKFERDMQVGWEFFFDSFLRLYKGFSLAGDSLPSMPRANFHGTAGGVSPDRLSIGIITFMILTGILRQQGTKIGWPGQNVQ